MARTAPRPCPRCDMDSRVLQTRTIKAHGMDAIYRLLECVGVERHHWSTMEVPNFQLSALVAQTPLADAGLVDQVPAALRGEAAG